MGERFVIRTKKNRNVIYNGKTISCKMSCIPVRPCEFPAKELVLTVEYGFGAEPMPLSSNLRMQEKEKLCHIIAKVYLLRWRIEEYFRFKKQQFEPVLKMGKLKLTSNCFVPVLL